MLDQSTGFLDSRARLSQLACLYQCAQVVHQSLQGNTCARVLYRGGREGGSKGADKEERVKGGDREISCKEGIQQVKAKRGPEKLASKGRRSIVVGMN